MALIDKELLATEEVHVHTFSYHRPGFDCDIFFRFDCEILCIVKSELEMIYLFMIRAQGVWSH